MTDRFSLVRLVHLCSLLPAGSLQAQPQGNVFSSSGGYESFAVDVAHRWYDTHTTEPKRQSSHCLSILVKSRKNRPNPLLQLHCTQAHRTLKTIGPHDRSLAMDRHRESGAGRVPSEPEFFFEIGFLLVELLLLRLALLRERPLHILAGFFQRPPRLAHPLLHLCDFVFRLR